MTNKHIALALSGTLVLAACDFDVPDLNRPALDQLNTNPTPALIAALATGLVAGSRADIAERIGYVSELGILGRESLVLSGSDDRFVTEMLNGASLDPSTPNFGGNFWLAEYQNIKNANLLLGALDKVAELTVPQRESVRGFAKTMKALDLLKVINTHDTNGAVLDPDLPIGQLAPFVDKATVLARISQLLDEASVHLAAASPAFPFPLGNGFINFNTPAQFLLVNRALAARVFVYRNLFASALTALAASFIDPATPGGTPASGTSLAPFPGTGVFHAFGNGSGDSQNALNTTDIFVHQSIISGAELKADGTLDNRVLAKTVAVTPLTLYGETGSNGFIMYPNTDSMVPIIRNEELILLRAEANIGLVLAGTGGSIGQARADINFIRQTSGGLAPKPASGLLPANILDELLKQKVYSLLFEGGHRWIDARHYGRLGTLPIDQPSIPQRVMPNFPIPTPEVNARAGGP
jgi:hypothetical protein